MKKSSYFLATLSILLVLMFLIVGAVIAPAHALGTLESELERNKKALKEFKTLSIEEQCLYLKISCEKLKNE